jgi:Leucine-rich repeat (LRR) protein
MSLPFLPSLRFLFLPGNLLAAVPDDFGRSAPALETLVLSDNRLVSISGLRHCSALQTLNLDSNPELAYLGPLLPLPLLRRLGLRGVPVAANKATSDFPNAEIVW